MKTLKVVVVSALAAILAVGCSEASSKPAADSAGEVKGYDEAMKEYDAAKSALTLPAGKSWDSAPKPKKESDGQRVTFQDGAATGKAESFWLCSWQQEWLKARGVDASRERTALENLDKFKTLRLYQKNFDEGSRKIYDDELAKAHLGDPSDVQDDVKANCA